MEKKFFGMHPTDGEVYSYILKDADTEVEIITKGGAIRRFVVFGTDIIGGFDTLEDYLADTSHQGALVGRTANRIANASFTMDGVVYKLPKNNGENNLHGGRGFDHRIWTVTAYSDTSITLEYISPDGEEGFPSEVRASITYTLFDNSLMIDYKVFPSGRTPISMTNHAYFNLNGLGADILDHEAEIFADTYTEVGADLIPNGEHPTVKGTAFDFLTPHKIGERVTEEFGYDHNFVLTPSVYKKFGDKELGLSARVSGEHLTMSVYTDQPGVQFYIGNFLGNGPAFKGGIPSIRRGAFCLETQTEPNSVNHGIGFYDKGEVYTHTTVYSIGRKG